MEINVTKALKDFLEEREDKFPNVTEKQRDKWIGNIETHIIDLLEDNDIFYDNIPEDIKEE